MGIELSMPQFSEIFGDKLKSFSNKPLTSNHLPLAFVPLCPERFSFVGRGGMRLSSCKAGRDLPQHGTQGRSLGGVS
jgi:hypothetical protein